MRGMWAVMAVVTVGAMVTSYWSGSAPWCRVDDFGNGQCYYYTLSSCRSALMGQNETCMFQGR